MSMRNITYVNRKGDARFRGHDKSRGGWLRFARKDVKTTSSVLELVQRKAGGMGKPGVAGWRLKPARGGSGRLALGSIATLQSDNRARLKRGGFFPHP